MKFVPEPYQVIFRDFLLGHDRAAGFLSIGLGKTATTLSALKILFAEGVIEKAFVVAPLRVARLTWINEIAKWQDFHFMKPCVLSGPDCNPPEDSLIHLTNFENLHNIEDLSQYGVVIIDELTKFKSHDSTSAKHLRTLLKPHPHIRRWGLTGTPRPNSLLELHSQIRMLDDGKRLSPSFHHFRSTYCFPTDFHEYNWVPKPNSERLIYEKINDIALTMKSSDYLKIPNTIVEDIEIRLPEAAHSIYRTLEKELVVYLKGGEVVARNAAILVNKLLQVCSGSVYDEARGVQEIHGSKIVALQRLLASSELEKENVIIVCNYLHEKARVLKALGSQAVDLSTFKGDIEKAWNGGTIKYLVVHPKSMSHGLNLQEGGRSLVWFSLTWSREDYDQVIGRIARKGQDQVTLIYRICASNTMDSVVLETLRVRGNEQGAMLDLLSNWQKQGRTFT